MKQPLFYITNLKFFAVILVLIGHSIQYTYTNNFDDISFFRWIYAFHMPLFFFISGFLINISKKDNFIISRFKTLFIPFICWAIFYCLYYYIDSKIIFPKYISNYMFAVFKSPDNGGLWFLWVLFICNILHFLVSKKTYKYIYYLLILVGLNTLYVLPNTHILGLGLVRWYFLFFVLGIYLGDKPISNAKFKYVILAISTLAAIFFVYKFKRNGVISNLHGKEFAVQMIYNLLAAISMIISVFLLFKNFININIPQIKWVSQQSLGFYATQFIVFTYSKPFFNQFTSNLFLITILSFSSAFSVCVILTLGLNKVPILKRSLLGQR